jgi:SAM-dependent methyltransferase
MYVPSAATSRPLFIASIPRNGLALETGALDKPILGRNVQNLRVLDVMDTETLRNKYARDPNVNIRNIANVDYVWSGQLYSDLISERFDTIVSSHNIEHQPDLIAYLTNLSSVLQENGSVYLMIPDYRYCFDAFKRASTIIDVLGANISESRAPTATSILYSMAHDSHNDPVRHWKGDHGPPIDLTDATKLRILYTQLKSRFTATPYIDTHVWTFTPTTFCQIMHTLLQMGLTDLYVSSCSSTRMNEFEFFVVLKRAQAPRTRPEI